MKYRVRIDLSFDNEADAEDASQVTMQKLFGQVGSYDHQRPALAWVLTIAAWECRTFRQRAARSKTVALELADALRDSDPSPEEQLMRRDLQAAVRFAIEELAENDQETLQQVLNEVNETSNTHRKRKQRALARLRNVWRRLYGTLCTIRTNSNPSRHSFWQS